MVLENENRIKENECGVVRNLSRFSNFPTFIEIIIFTKISTGEISQFTLNLTRGEPLHIIKMQTSLLLLLNNNTLA